MTDFLSMTYPEQLAEAARRNDRQRKGLPLSETPVEKAERLEEEDQRSEKLIQAEVVKLFRAYGCMVYSLSQPRESKQTPGLPDLFVFHAPCRRAWWFETKTPSGKQSPAQESFELNCVSTGIAYVLGGVASAEQILIQTGAAERSLSGELEPTRRAAEEHLVKVGAAERILSGELEPKRGLAPLKRAIDLWGHMA